MVGLTTLRRAFDNRQRPVCISVFPLPFLDGRRKAAVIGLGILPSVEQPVAMRDSPEIVASLGPINVAAAD